MDADIGSKDVLSLLVLPIDVAGVTADALGMNACVLLLLIAMSNAAIIVMAFIHSTLDVMH